MIQNMSGNQLTDVTEIVLPRQDTVLRRQESNIGLCEVRLPCFEEVLYRVRR